MYQSPRRNTAAGKASTGTSTTHKKRSNSQNRLYFESPRCDLPDNELFGTATQHANLIQHDERWKYLQEQAGQHGQTGQVQYVNVKEKDMTPAALRSGMPLQAAARVLSLHLELDERDDRLPAWLDVITTVYFNLQHLYLGRASTTDPYVDRNDDGDDGDGSQDNWQESQTASSPKISNRMRRLYILYRLPDLLSIDGITVTAQERLLARPNDPNGARVKREEWVESSLLDRDRTALDDDDDEDDEEHTDDGDHYGERMDDDESEVVGATPLSPNCEDAVEVDLHGAVKLVEGSRMKTVSRLGQQKQNRDAPAEQVVTDDNDSEDNIRDSRNQEEKKEEISPGPLIPELAGLDDLRKTTATDFKYHKHLEYEASTDNGTAAACEWSAACGSLSLPYFRADSARRLKCAMSSNNGNGGTTSSSSAAKSKIRLFGRKHKDPAPIEEDAKDDVETGDSSLQKEEGKVQEEPPKAQSPSPVSPRTTHIEEQAAPRMTPLIDSSSSSSSADTEVDLVDVVTTDRTTIDKVEPPELPRLFEKKVPPAPKNSLSRIGEMEVPPAPKNSSMLQRTLENSDPPPNNSDPPPNNSDPPPNKLPPSKSLSSPFPIQFRVRAKIGQSPPRQLSVSTKLNAESDCISTSPPPPPPLRRRSPSDAEMETIESPIELIRVQSSPSYLSQSGRLLMATSRGGLPPPSPGTRRTTPTLGKGKEKKKRGVAKWRQKLSARSSSIIDEDDDDDEDDDEEDDIEEEEGDDQQDVLFSSANENVVVQG
jgi:hypothetical protein